MYNKKHLPFIFIQHFKTGSMEWPNLVGFRWILNAFRADLIGWSKTACPYFFFVLGLKPLSVTKNETLSFLPYQQLHCLNPKSKNPNLPKPQNNHVLFRLTLFNGRPKLRL